MSHIVRARVEVKKKYHDKERNLKEALNALRTEVSDAGIAHDLKRKQFYESKSEIKRRKKREARNRVRRDALEVKVLSGERVKAPSGVVKKIMERHRAKNDKKKARDRGHYGKK
jgi:ribosomal protein S21